MSYTIGLLWPGYVRFEDSPLPEDVLLIQNVRIDQVPAYVDQLTQAGVEIILGTPSMYDELHLHSSLPVIITHANFIDILETVKEAERLYYPREHQAAVIFHEKNPHQLERMSTFTKFEMSYYSYGEGLSLEEIMDKIKHSGCSLVIGGPTSCSLAQSLGYTVAPLRYKSHSLLPGIQNAKEFLSRIRSERKQTEFLRTVLHTIPDGILVTDDAGHISMCNDQLAKYLGASKESLANRPVVEVFNDDGWRDVYEKGLSQPHFLSKYGKNAYFTTRRPVMTDGHLIGAVGILQEANKIQTMERKYRYSQTKGLVSKHHFSDIVASSPAMNATISEAMQCAKFDATVLIEGETGTGKELFAQSIHNESPRKMGPFVAINCAAVSPSLLESELMGYEEGAFTGAKRGGRMGLFEQAHNGTIFLDEINQMPVELQPKLLRVIQEKTLTRVGGSNVIPVNVRIIAASNERLSRLVASGAFRRDLYYRLNILSLIIPPLRTRPDDILPLISHFIQKFQNNPHSYSLNPEDIARTVQHYNWPGNVRELQNYVERCTIFGIDIASESFWRSQSEDPPLQNRVEQPASEEPYVQVKISSLRQMERQLVREVVEHCGGNKSRAALLLGINRNTVNSKLE